MQASNQNVSTWKIINCICLSLKVKAHSFSWFQQRRQLYAIFNSCESKMGVATRGSVNYNALMICHFFDWADEGIRSVQVYFVIFAVLHVASYFVVNELYFHLNDCSRMLRKFYDWLICFQFPPVSGRGTPGGEEFSECGEEFLNYVQ